ncbi:MAG TPA: hypothetical protein VGK22_03300 [Candidatus Angelobacter sp.]|jgi:hypothetical protein
MNLRYCLILSILFFISFGSSASSAWVVRFNSTGPVKIGMSLSQLNAALHEKFSMPEDKDEQACFYAEPAKHPGVAIMIEKGYVTRVDVFRPDISSAEGIRIGDSEARAKQVYGNKLKIEPHAYTGPEGHYLTARSSDGLYGIRFETDGKKILSFYAGKKAAISYIEGCQ